MSHKNESSYKLKEFGIVNEGSSDARFDQEHVTIETLKESLKIVIKNINADLFEMEFDMIGVGAPIANAIRRILIAEVPSMAIDKVFMYNNTSIIQDEVLALRLGLVPIKIDPRLFEYREKDDEEGTEEDTIQFQLKVKCTNKLNVSKDACLPDALFNHSSVYTSDLEFLPIGNQKKMHGDIRPVHENILLAKLRPGHEIELAAHCVKNIGREHAKFSPVATASYRLLTQIKLLEEITGERAHRLVDCFPEGVLKVSKKKGREVAKIVDPRKITCSRNIFRHEDLKNVVEVSKFKDHYIFNVESSGALPPDVLVSEAINILKEKCRYFLTQLKLLKI